jgi:hypothetical protein
MIESKLLQDEGICWQLPAVLKKNPTEQAIHFPFWNLLHPRSETPVSVLTTQTLLESNA